MDSQSVIDARVKRLEAEPLFELGNKSGLVRGTKAAVADLWQRRELLGLLVSRELKARYKDSTFGFAWSMVKPLSQLLIYFIVIGQFLGAARGIPQFAIFVFSGLTAWGFFLEILNSGTASIVNNAGLVKKVYLPREVFPLASMGNAMVNSGVQFLILLAAVIVTRQFPSIHTIGYLPIGILLLGIYGLAAALLFSALNVYLRDIQHLIEVGTFLAFWASPVVYSYSYVANALPGWMAEIYLANPVTLGILAFQRSMWVAGVDQPYPEYMALRMLVALVIGVCLLFGAHRVFIRFEGNFAQEL